MAPTSSRPTTRPVKTREDFLSLPDHVRAELIHGELYVTPAPRRTHQRTLLRLSRILAEQVDQLSGELFLAAHDVFLPSGDIVQPDLMYVGAEQAGISREDGIHGVPRLVIEIISPAVPERDRVIKRSLYERNGVPEYWMVEPEDEGIQLLCLRQQRFKPHGWFTTGTVLHSRAVPGLSVPIDGLFPSQA